MERTNRSKAIRLKCLDCCGDNSHEVSLCTCTNCPLWRYRRGKEERDELYIPRKQKEEEVEDDS